MPESPGLVLWIRLLFRHFRFLAAVSFGAGVLTLITVLLLPLWYEARTSILPPHEDTPSYEAINAVSASLQMERFLPFTERVSLADVYLAILESETVARALVERFELQERYKQSTLVRTVQALRKNTTIAPSLRRIIEVRVRDKDPEFAADLARAYIEELDRVFRETRSSAGERQRIFLERRLVQAKAELDSAEAVLTELQRGKGVTALSRDMSEAAVAAGDLLGKRMTLDIQLEMLKEMGFENSPLRQEVEMELAAVSREIARLPELGLDLAQKIRDLRIREFLYEELVKQLEAARIEEARDTPSVEVLDVALPPDRHSHPRRGLTTIAGAMLGFALSFMWVAYRESRA